MANIKLGNVYFVEMDAMVHGKRPVVVVGIKGNKVTLMPLTSRMDCLRRWDVVIEPSIERGVYKQSKTSPDYTQVHNIGILPSTPVGRIEKELVIQMLAGWEIWKLAVASKNSKKPIKKA